MTAPGQGNKRKLVSFDDRSEELQESKRQKMELNEEQKKKVLKAISAIYLYVTSKHNLPLNNLHVSAQIAKIMMSTFRRMKQEISKIGHLSDHDAKHFTVTYCGNAHELKREDVKKQMEEVFRWFGLAMIAPRKEEKGHWWGTFMPMLAYCIACRLQLDELRVGHSTFPIGKETDRNN